MTEFNYRCFNNYDEIDCEDIINYDDCSDLSFNNHFKNDVYASYILFYELFILGTILFLLSNYNKESKIIKKYYISSDLSETSDDYDDDDDENSDNENKYFKIYSKKIKKVHNELLNDYVHIKKDN